jgi:hypothetical protein
MLDFDAEQYCMGSAHFEFDSQESQILPSIVVWKV